MLEARCKGWIIASQRLHDPVRVYREFDLFRVICEFRKLINFQKSDINFVVSFFTQFQQIYQFVKKSVLSGGEEVCGKHVSIE